jgi:META domain-containing protein
MVCPPNPTGVLRSRSGPHPRRFQADYCPMPAMSNGATISKERISFGAIASTRMACTPAVMDQEGKFFAVLREVQSWRIDPTRQKLILLDANKRPLIVLARM